MNVALYLFLMFLEALLLLGVIVYFIGLIFSSVKGAPYVPTSKNQLEKIFKNIAPKKGDMFVELGSGDGRITRYAANKYAVKGIGIDINPLLVLWSNLLSKYDRTNVAFFKQNVFNFPLGKADYLYIFLMPQLIEKLLPKFKKELKKGCVVISHGFKIVSYEKKLFHTEFDKSFSTFYYKI